MYYIASKYIKNKYNIEHEVSFLVTEFFPHDNTSNIIGNYGISCYPYDTTIDLEKENINSTEEGDEKTFFYPFHISVITNVRYINKFANKNLNFLKYKTPFYSLTAEHYVEYFFLLDPLNLMFHTEVIIL